MRFYLSTFCWVIFLGSIFLGINFIDYHHYDRQNSSDVEAYYIMGYGWPVLMVTHGHFSFGSLLGNILFILGCLFWFSAVLEGYVEYLTFQRGDLYRALIFAAIWAGLTIPMAFLPVVSDVSFGIVFKPWWECWRSLLVVFLVAMICRGVLRWMAERLKEYNL